MRRSRSSKASLASGLLAAFASTAAEAQGCGPTRLKVSESITLNVTPAKLWAIVGDFQNVSWDPTIATARGSGGNEVDRAVRTLTVKGGAVFAESLYKYDAQTMSYAYHLDKVEGGDLPVQNLSATLEVVAVDAGRSKLIWRAAFYRLLKPGEPEPDVADAAAAKATSDFLRAGLEGFKASLDPKT